MTSNYGNLHMETKKHSKQNDNIQFNTLRNYTTLYHTYKLLYCKGHIQMTSNNSNVNVETRKRIE